MTVISDTADGTGAFEHSSDCAPLAAISEENGDREARRRQRSMVKQETARAMNIASMLIGPGCTACLDYIASHSPNHLPATRLTTLSSSLLTFQSSHLRTTQNSIDEAVAAQTIPNRYQHVGKTHCFHHDVIRHLLPSPRNRLNCTLMSSYIANIYLLEWPDAIVKARTIHSTVLSTPYTPS